MRCVIGTRRSHETHAPRVLNRHGAAAHAGIVNARIRIALIAHDGQKQDMVEWAAWNRALLRDADLCGTRHTATLVSGAIGAPVRALLSGPRGGDAQIGAMVAKRELDLVVSSGIRSRPTRTRPMFARYFGSRSCTTCRSPATAGQPTSS